MQVAKEATLLGQLHRKTALLDDNLNVNIIVYL